MVHGEDQRHIFEEKLERDLGAKVIAALNEQDVVEIYTNGDGALWVERLGSSPKVEGEIGPASIRQVLADVAHYMGKTVSEDSPIVEGTLPKRFHSARFAGSQEPVSLPSFNLRKPAIQLFTLDDYVSGGSMTSLERQWMKEKLAGKNNLLIAGGTGSGKTTFANACLGEIAESSPNDRIVIIEDSDEIQCSSKDHQKLLANAKQPYLELLKTTLRRRPTRIVVGEVRGGEALELLRMWNSGHPGGLCTVHCNSALDALEKIELAILEITESSMSRFIAASIDAVIYLKRGESRPYVEQIIEVAGFDHETGKYELRTVFHHQIDDQKESASAN